MKRLLLLLSLVACVPKPATVTAPMALGATPVVPGPILPTGPDAGSCGSPNTSCVVTKNSVGQILAMSSASIDIGPGQIACPMGEVPVGIDGGVSECAFPYAMEGGEIDITTLDGGPINITGLPGPVQIKSWDGGIRLQTNCDLVNGCGQSLTCDGVFIDDNTSCGIELLENTNGDYLLLTSTGITAYAPSGGTTVWNGGGPPVLSSGGTSIVNAAAVPVGISISDRSGNGIDQNTDGGWTVESETANITTSGLDGGNLQIRAEGAPNTNVCIESGAICTSRAGQNIDLNAATGAYITSGSSGINESSTGAYSMAAAGGTLYDNAGIGIVSVSDGGVSTIRSLSAGSVAGQVVTSPVFGVLVSAPLVTGGIIITTAGDGGVTITSTAAAPIIVTSDGGPVTISAGTATSPQSVVINTGGGTVTPGNFGRIIAASSNGSTTASLNIDPDAGTLIGGPLTVTGAPFVYQTTVLDCTSGCMPTALQVLHGLICTSTGTAPNVTFPTMQGSGGIVQSMFLAQVGSSFTVKLVSSSNMTTTWGINAGTGQTLFGGNPILGYSDVEITSRVTDITTNAELVTSYL